MLLALCTVTSALTRLSRAVMVGYLKTGSLLGERIRLSGGRGSICRLLSRLGVNCTVAKLTFAK